MDLLEYRVIFFFTNFAIVVEVNIFNPLLHDTRYDLYFLIRLEILKININKSCG